MAHRTMWEIEIRHEGLNKYRKIRGSDRYVVEHKAIAQQLSWDEMWRNRQAAEEKRQARESATKSKEEKKALADQRTCEAQDTIAVLEGVLLHTLHVDDAIAWDSLLDKKEFTKEKPPRQELSFIRPEPRQSEAQFRPKLNLFDKLFPKSRLKKVEEATKAFELHHVKWVAHRDEMLKCNTRIEELNARMVADWEKAKQDFVDKQTANNQKVLEHKSRYFEKHPDAIVDYCELVLSQSQYPEYFPQQWDLEYNPDSRILVVDYSLPDIEAIPTVTNVKYVIAKDEFVESHLSQAALNKLYDNVLYQIALRTVHELYEADVVSALDSVVFNGWVESINKSTGHHANSCIMSLQANREEFLHINLEKVDPKACFKQLKGISASKLHGLSPIAPIINISKEDRRFVSPYDVADQIQDSDNLATMDWQDFENLIRELFEKEFTKSGGEVKITQASRDGGVDAVAFDPDPIRGGKIVIQAKRYTNVVGVAAVRDLYGTTVNEGATKGILVTTSDFGPDAYEFAKNKPLTLLNGGNLLHLLASHGHNARIDLHEAKQWFADHKS